MSSPEPPEPHEPPPDASRVPPTESQLRSARLWGGGLMTALVAALAAAVALLLVRRVLGIEVFAPEGNGDLTLADTGSLAMGAAAAALLATVLLFVLLVTTPAPLQFFGWIVGLVTAAAILLPFTRETQWDARLASAGVYLLIGLVIGTLLTAVGRRAVR